MADNNNVDVERVDEYGDAPSVNSNGTDASQQQAQQAAQVLQELPDRTLMLMLQRPL